MNGVALPKRAGVTFNIQAVSGWDVFLQLIYTRPMFARHVARKLEKAGRYVDYFKLPDGTEWDRKGYRLGGDK